MSLKRTRAIDENEEVALFRRVRMKTSIVYPNIDSEDDEKVEADTDETRYCYCNRVTYGEMIGCENLSCEREWFHLDCVGLKDAPFESELFLSIMPFHPIAIAPAY